MTGGPVKGGQLTEIIAFTQIVEGYLFALHGKIDDAHAPMGDEINIPGFVHLIENLFAGRKAAPPARHFEIPALLVRQVDEGADIRQIVLLRYRHIQPLLREPLTHVIAPRTENRAFDPSP